MAVNPYKVRKCVKKILFGIAVLIIVIPILFPLYFVLISSFKNMAQVYIMLQSSLDLSLFLTIIFTYLKHSIMVHIFGIQQ